MHKNFANTLFLAKRVFYLPQCHSTNDVLFEKIKAGESFEGDLVISDFQTKGKGQRGSYWESDSGENLLFSIHLSPSFLLPDKSYLLNIVASNALIAAISFLFPEHNFSIKWPNDLYAGDKKIAGILVQTILEGNRMKDAILGIGLNVNQEHFLSLSTATSLYKLSNQPQDRDAVLESIVSALECNYLLLKSGKKDQLIRNYHDQMRWRGEIHQFKDLNGVFEGEIIGIDPRGNLSVRVEGNLRSYGIKEIEFIK